MRKQSYEINPSSLKINHCWSNLGRSERGLFRDILDLIWLSDKQYRMPYNPTSLAELLCVSVEDLEQALAKMMMGDQPLLVEEFDLEEAGGFFLSSPLLRDQISAHQRWIREEKHRSMLRNQDREQAVSLVARINQAKSSSDPHVAYLKPEDRDLSCYKGWLPTDRFESQGQVYYVRDTFLSMLRESYPDENVDNEIVRIHAWLVKKPFGRKRLAMMNRFVINWLENQAEFRDRDANNASEVEDELDRLLGISTGKAASV